MDIAVILPTYNERDNIPHVIRSLSAALEQFRWEAIFVDDDSPDGTAEVIANYARTMPNIRLIHRIGRRGLSTACIDGMMASQAKFLAVMDADGQHDERVLPRMLERLHAESLDVVVATRHADGGSMGEFCAGRVLLSRTGRALSKAVCRTHLSDPMSGFFALRRDFLLEVVHDLQGCGFKVLVDLLASARRPVRVGEVGYTFRERCHGESKLDALVGVEYITLVLSKLLDGMVSAEMLLYLLVGTAALLLHMLVLVLLGREMHLHFIAVQVCAAVLAGALIFQVNNRITFRDRRLRGMRILLGAMQFAAACSLGLWASEFVARTLLHDGIVGTVSGTAGAVFGTVWNLSVASQFTWGLRLRLPKLAEEPYRGILEVPR